jgi:hypothetical protein
MKHDKNGHLLNEDGTLAIDLQCQECIARMQEVQQQDWKHLSHQNYDPGTKSQDIP